MPVNRAARKSPMKNFLPLCIVIAYMVVLYAIAWYSTRLRKQGGARGFFLADRGFPTGIIAVMLCGMAVGGASTVGVAQEAYTRGLSAGMYNAAWGAGAIICGLVAARRLRNMNVYTLPEFFERFYGKPARYIGVVSQLAVLMTIVALQYVAGGAILTALLPEYFSLHTGMVLTAVAFVGICIIGGYWAAGLSNLINVIVIYFGLILGAVAVVNSAGGLGAISQAMPEPKWFSFVEGKGWVPIIAWFTVMITQVTGGQGPVQVSFAAKNGNMARRGFIIAGLMILPAGFISALFGITAAMQVPGLTGADTALALPKVVLAQDPLIAGLILAGLWAADVSTAVGLLLGGATMILRDIVRPLQRHKPEPKRELLTSRLLVLAAALVTLFMALQVRSVLGTIMIGLSITAPTAIILLTTFFCPGLCRKSSAFWCLAAGLLVIFVWVFGPGFLAAPLKAAFPHVIFPEWIAGALAFLLVAVLDKNKCVIPAGYARQEEGAEG